MADDKKADPEQSDKGVTEDVGAEEEERETDDPPVSGRVPKFRAQPVMPSSRGAKVGLISGPSPSYPGTRFWIWCVSAIVLSVLGYSFFASRSREGRKDVVLAKREAARSSFEKSWPPFETAVEKALSEHVLALSEKEASGWDFRSLPGFYVRLRARDASNIERRKAAIVESRRDGFSGCLMRPVGGTVPPASVGLPESERHVPGETEQPWNLAEPFRLARVFSEDWKKEVLAAGDEMRLRIFEEQFDKAAVKELPKLAEMLKSAEVLVALLDDENDDSSALTFEDLQMKPHRVRTLIFNLKTGSVYARIFREGAGAVQMLSGAVDTKPEVRAAMQRQVNNCTLAKSVQAALGLP